MVSRPHSLLFGSRELTSNADVEETLNDVELLVSVFSSASIMSSKAQQTELLEH